MRALLLRVVPMVLVGACAGSGATGTDASAAETSTMDVARVDATTVDTTVVDTQTADALASDTPTVDRAVLDAAPVDMVALDATPVDATNPCTARGGTCVVASRGGGGVPGFTLMCPAGTATTSGQTQWLGPGTDLLAGGRISGGCPPGEGSFEPPLYGCCLPIDGGLDP